MTLIPVNEAMRLGSMATTQGFGGGSIADAKAPCALGAAMLAVGKLPESAVGGIKCAAELWPVLKTLASCPVCSNKQSVGLYEVVWHLNDFHRWTREDIARFVQTIEDAQTPPDPSCDRSEVAPEKVETTAVGVVANRT